MIKENKLKTTTSPAHWVSTDDVNTAYLNAINNPASDGKAFNIAGPEDCRTTFKSMQDEIAIALGGKASSEEDWGGNPYPQRYYDISASDAVLDYVKTPRAGIIKNLVDALGNMDEFYNLSRG